MPLATHIHSETHHIQCECFGNLELRDVNLLFHSLSNHKKNRMGFMPNLIITYSTFMHTTSQSTRSEANVPVKFWE